MNKRWTINSSLAVSFTIELCDNLFSVEKVDVLNGGSSGPGSRRIVFVDERVFRLFGEKIEHFFVHHNIDVHIVRIVCAEVTKDLQTFLTIIEELEKFHILRQSEPVIAIGGGVLLDIVGFAAGTYQRGVPYIRVPTTLLALVDASVGAKTAINYFQRRNRLGSYYPPISNYLDRTFLLTLDRREFSNGLSEILKMGLLKDLRLFELLEEHGQDLIDGKFQGDGVAIEVINRSISTMVEELEPNLWEKDLKRIVDFGHSFSPLIEMRALPELSHGEAVALDMLFSCLISNHRSMLSDGEVDRIFSTVKKLGLPVFHPLFADLDALQESLEDTIAHRNGAQNLPMLESIGKTTFLQDVTTEQIKRAAEELRERAGRE